MNIFQKLSWMRQMGIRYLCGEQAHPLEKKQVKQTSVSLSELDKKIQKSKSALSATATHSFGGIGIIPADVMCVLESPSASEDRTGEALSGPEGELLKKMLKAIGLDTSKQTYVAYLSPWRAPGARVLTSLETQEGVKLLNERIKVVQPKILLLFGMPVVKALLNMPLGQTRSKQCDYHGIPVFATFGPSFLLKNTRYKKEAWSDLKKLQEFLTKNTSLC